MTIDELIQLAKKEGLLFEVCSSSKRLGNTQTITLISIRLMPIELESKPEELPKDSCLACGKQNSESCNSCMLC